MYHVNVCNVLFINDWKK